MDAILTALSQWARHLGARAGLAVAGLAALGAALVAAAYVLLIVAPDWAMLPAVPGAAAGAAWFAALFVAWQELLPEPWRTRVNLRAAWPLPRRRLAAWWAAIAWFTMLVLAGAGVNSPVIGALNVTVLLTVWRLGSMTAVERDAAAVDAAIDQQIPWDDETAGDEPDANASR